MLGQRDKRKNWVADPTLPHSCTAEVGGGPWACTARHPQFTTLPCVAALFPSERPRDRCFSPSIAASKGSFLDGLRARVGGEEGGFRPRGARSTSTPWAAIERQPTQRSVQSEDRVASLRQTGLSTLSNARCLTGMSGSLHREREGGRESGQGYQ
ncbi:hypothetical protein BKA80DRAFT_121360 [Phyllosticta citrichinensis]